MRRASESVSNSCVHRFLDCRTHEIQHVHGTRQRQQFCCVVFGRRVDKSRYAPFVCKVRPADSDDLLNTFLKTVGCNALWGIFRVLRMK